MARQFSVAMRLFTSLVLPCCFLYKIQRSVKESARQFSVEPFSKMLHCKLRWHGLMVEFVVTTRNTSNNDFQKPNLPLTRQS